jgi:hypothetical protein
VRRRGPGVRAWGGAGVCGAGSGTRFAIMGERRAHWLMFSNPLTFELHARLKDNKYLREASRCIAYPRASHPRIGCRAPPLLHCSDGHGTAPAALQRRTRAR